jgi:hypothetical protein
MVESAIRSRTRAPQKPGNPFIFWGILAGCVGLVFVGLAAYFFKTRSEESEQARKWKRGVELVNQLTPIACDYFYAGKKGPLPDEVWAPFKAYEKDRDLFDAALIVKVPMTDQTMIIDQARYKGNKAEGGMQVRRSTYPETKQYYGRPGPLPEPTRTQVEIVKGEVEAGGVSKKVVFFRRPILENESKTGFEYGQAEIILFEDVQSPAGASGASPAKPDKPAPAVKTDAKPDAKPEGKSGPAPAPVEPKPAAGEPKKDVPAPAAKP